MAAGRVLNCTPWSASQVQNPQSLEIVHQSFASFCRTSTGQLILQAGRWGAVHVISCLTVDCGGCIWQLVHLPVITRILFWHVVDDAPAWLLMSLGVPGLFGNVL
jgi:hypothetical protein